MTPKEEMGSKKYLRLDHPREVVFFKGFLTSQCQRCQHFDEVDYCCSAFPDGVPDSILDGSKTHETVLEGQKGNTVFKKI